MIKLTRIGHVQLAVTDLTRLFPPSRLPVSGADETANGLH